MACQPPFCNSTEFVFSASKLSTTFVVFPFAVKVIATFLPSPIVYSMYSLFLTSSYTPLKSNPKLPSLASIRQLNLPPFLTSFSARGECQSSEAWFHFVICSGLVQYSHTFCTGALTVLDTV